MTTSWPVVGLHEVSRPKQWPTVSKAELTETGYPVYGANGLIGRYHSYNHEKETILITCRGATCGSVNVCQRQSWVTGNAMALDDLDSSRVDLRYLVHFLRHDGLQSAVTGTAQPQITRETLKRIRVPLPPLAQQRRIAEILDTADELRQKRREAIEKVGQVVDALFADVIGPLEAWPIGKLGDHVPTTSGGTPARSRSDYFGGDVPWVKSGELGSGSIHATGESITDEALANSSAKLMPVGTVLVAMYGATIGEVATLAIAAATNQAVCCLSPTDEITGPYLAGFLRSMKDELIRRGAGGAQPNISQTIIRNLDLPLPPMSVQAQYAQLLDRVAATSDVLEASEAHLGLLVGSLQQRAFRGVL